MGLDHLAFVIVMHKLHLLCVARCAMHLFRGDCTRTLPTSTGAESAKGERPRRWRQNRRAIVTVIAEDITVRVATGAEDAIGAAVMVGGIERAALQMAYPYSL